MNLVIMFFLAMAFVHILNFASKRSRTRRTRLPPGPSPLPIFGNLFDLGEQPHKSLAELAKIHGPLISLKLGQVTNVVVSSPTMAKVVLQKHDLKFSNRAVIQAIQALDHHKAAMPWLPVDSQWRNLRKICNSYIFTNHKLKVNQNLRLDKVQQLIADVQKCCNAGVAIDIGQAAFRTMLNTLSGVVFSLDLTDSSSDTVLEFKEVVRCIMDELGKPNLADFFPFLRWIDPQGIRRRMTGYVGKMLDLFDHIIDERLLARNDVGYVTSSDMLDTLLNLNEHGHKDTDRTTVKHLFVDLFVAGTDTTSSTLEWAMTELVRNPDILSRARRELEYNIGKTKTLEESDIPQLPYLQAIVKETLRVHPPTPLLLPRIAGADVELNGYTIPKHAQVLVNAWAIGRDPSAWKEPEMFFPERFLESGVDVRGQDFELIPFGAGRRICPGTSLALRMLHLMLGSLIISFDWKLENGVLPETLDMEDKFGITLQKAQPLKVLPIQL